MDYFAKYRHQENPFLRGAISGIQSLADGSRPKDILFRMHDDNEMREWLDEEDFAFWMKEKAAFLAS